MILSLSLKANDRCKELEGPVTIALAVSGYESTERKQVYTLVPANSFLDNTLFDSNTQISLFVYEDWAQLSIFIPSSKKLMVFEVKNIEVLRDYPCPQSSIFTARV